VRRECAAFREPPTAAPRRASLVTLHSVLRHAACLAALVLACGVADAVRAPIAHAAWPTPLALGKEGISSEFNEGDVATADNLLNDVWPARSPLQPVHLDWPLSWTEDPYGDAYWRFCFYSLRPTSSLLWAYATTRDQRYHGGSSRSCLRSSPMTRCGGSTG
jgi:hypothetical protein